MPVESNSSTCNVKTIYMSDHHKTISYYTMTRPDRIRIGYFLRTEWYSNLGSCNSRRAVLRNTPYLGARRKSNAQTAEQSLFFRNCRGTCQSILATALRPTLLSYNSSRSSVCVRTPRLYLPPYLLRFPPVSSLHVPCEHRSKAMWRQWEFLPSLIWSRRRHPPHRHTYIHRSQIGVVCCRVLNRWDAFSFLHDNPRWHRNLESTPHLLEKYTTCRLTHTRHLVLGSIHNAARTINATHGFRSRHIGTH